MDDGLLVALVVTVGSIVVAALGLLGSRGSSRAARERNAVDGFRELADARVEEIDRYKLHARELEVQLREHRAVITTLEAQLDALTDQEPPRPRKRLPRSDDEQV